MRSMVRKSSWPIALGLVVVAAALRVVSANELDPPGPPGNTFETQIRAADLPMNITVAGSYHLSEDINTGGGGITVSASNVTIDLMGFTLDGGVGDGIVAGAFSNIVVKNGTVRGWAGDGVDLGSALNSQVTEVCAEGNGADGIRIGNGGLVRGCT